MFFRAHGWWGQVLAVSPIDGRKGLFPPVGAFYSSAVALQVGVVASHGTDLYVELSPA
jgi:hypothetical protein